MEFLKTSSLLKCLSAKQLVTVSAVNGHLILAPNLNRAIVNSEVRTLGSVMSGGNKCETQTRVMLLVVVALAGGSCVRRHNIPSYLYCRNNCNNIAVYGKIFLCVT